MPESEQTQEPKQKRSEQTREKILKTGLRLFSEHGYHATSSKKIAKAAGISIGSFYNYFKDKKELLLEIHRLHVEKIHNAVATKLTGPNLINSCTDSRSIVQNIIDTSLKLHEFSPELHRELSALIYTDSDFAKMGIAEENRVVNMIVELLSIQSNALRVTDLEATARVIAHSIESVVHSIKIFGAPIEQKRLTDVLGDMVHRLLYR